MLEDSKDYEAMIYVQQLKDYCNKHFVDNGDSIDCDCKFFKVLNNGRMGCKLTNSIDYLPINW